jgi:hypothetical protein
MPLAATIVVVAGAMIAAFMNEKDPGVMSHVSHVMRHVPHVMSHVPHVMSHVLGSDLVFD